MSNKSSDGSIKSGDMVGVQDTDPNSPLNMFLRGTAPQAEPQKDAFQLQVEEMIKNANPAPLAAHPAPTGIRVGTGATRVTTLNELTITDRFRIKYLENFVGNKTSGRVSIVDLYASVPETFSLNSAERRIASIPCGIVLALPVGFEAHIRPLSDWASKGILVIPMTVKSTFRGEIVCVAFNLSTRAFRIDPGTRLAELVISPVFEFPLVEDSSIIDDLVTEGSKGQ